MTTESAREYLSKYRALCLKENRLKYMAEDSCESRKRYEKQIKKCEKLKKTLEDSIDRVDGAVLSEILASKYICGRSLEETAELIGYCKRQVERLHVKAIEIFCKVNRRLKPAAI